MLAAMEYANRYTKPRIYENHWIDNHSIRIPWLNFLTAQSIPEETDVIDSPKRIRTISDCSSSSSIDEYNIVHDVQRPSSINEELNFAQIKEDEHRVEHDQFAESLIIEVHLKRNAIEHQAQQMMLNGGRVRVTQLLIHLPKKPFESVLTPINVSPDIPKQKTNQLINTSKQQSINHRCSIASFDSSESDSHISNSISTQQDKSTLETTTFTRTFTFERVKEQKINYAETYHEEQPVLPFYLDNNLSKPTTLLRLVKKRNRIVNSEYYLPNDEVQTNEPTLLQVKYLDGRRTLTNFNALESLEKSKLLSTSISSRMSLSKLSTTKDVSYGKRILNRFQRFFRPNPNEQSKPWQQKTILELLNEKKTLK